jgi:hypothetical protein
MYISKQREFEAKFDSTGLNLSFMKQLKQKNNRDRTITETLQQTKAHRSSGEKNQLPAHRSQAT